MKVLLFGTGRYYQRYKDCFKNVEIMGLLDNNIEKQGSLIDGHVVYAPEQADALPFEQIWLLSFDTDDMRRQLLSLGVLDSLIYEVWDLGEALGDNLTALVGKFYQPGGVIRETLMGDAVDRVVLLTPNLLLNGAEIALVQMVRTIMCLGYKPLVASLQDGELRQELLSLGVPVILMGEAAHEIPLAKIPYLAGAKGYIFNTIEMYLMLQKRYESVPVAWWLHDSEMIYQETHIIDEPLSKLDLEDVDIRVVSPIAAEAFQQHYGKKVSVKVMPYGLHDWASKESFKRKYCKSQTFAIVGNISVLKAQEDFICAVKLLPKIVRNCCRFCIIGSERNKVIVEELKKKAEGVPCIQFMGEMGRAELLRFYAEEMDVLVCPSRSDTLPIVTVEAMMFSHPVIVSEAVGTSSMLLEVGAGLSIPVGDAKALAKSMQWMYEHSAECELMGKSARQLYERNFTLECFHQRVENFMHELIGIC